MSKFLTAAFPVAAMLAGGGAHAACDAANWKDCAGKRWMIAKPYTPAGEPWRSNTRGGWTSVAQGEPGAQGEIKKDLPKTGGKPGDGGGGGGVAPPVRPPSAPAPDLLLFTFTCKIPDPTTPNQLADVAPILLPHLQDFADSLHTSQPMIFPQPQARMICRKDNKAAGGIWRSTTFDAASLDQSLQNITPTITSLVQIQFNPGLISSLLDHNFPGSPGSSDGQWQTYFTGHRIIYPQEGHLQLIVDGTYEAIQSSIGLFGNFTATFTEAPTVDDSGTIIPNATTSVNVDKAAVDGLTFFALGFVFPANGILIPFLNDKITQTASAKLPAAPPITPAFAAMIPTVFPIPGRKKIVLNLQDVGINSTRGMTFSLGFHSEDRNPSIVISGQDNITSVTTSSPRRVTLTADLVATGNDLRTPLKSVQWTSSNLQAPITAAANSLSATVTANPPGIATVSTTVKVTVVDQDDLTASQTADVRLDPATANGGAAGDPQLPPGTPPHIPPGKIPDCAAKSGATC